MLSIIFYEMALKLKEPLTWEVMDKISWKSWRLYLKARPIDWHHFQPNKSRWTVPLTGRSVEIKGDYFYSLKFLFNCLTSPPSVIFLPVQKLLKQRPRRKNVHFWIKLASYFFVKQAPTANNLWLDPYHKLAVLRLLLLYHYRQSFAPKIRNL